MTALIRAHIWATELSDCASKLQRWDRSNGGIESHVPVNCNETSFLSCNKFLENELHRNRFPWCYYLSLRSAFCFANRTCLNLPWESWFRLWDKKHVTSISNWTYVQTNSWAPFSVMSLVSLMLHVDIMERLDFLDSRNVDLDVQEHFLSSLQPVEFNGGNETILVDINLKLWTNSWASVNMLRLVSQTSNLGNQEVQSAKS